MRCPRGASAPTVTVAFQPWVDTSSDPPVYKIRNSANTGWITVGVLDTNFEVGGITQIANGGTGQTTATAAINALLPSQTGNSGEYLTTDGTNVSWSSAAGLIRIPQILTSGTSYTPPTGCTKIYVEAVGGGQGGTNGLPGPFGGGSDGVGGTSGGFSAKFFSVTSTTTFTMAIGAAGTAGGGNGGNTTFTELVNSVVVTTITAPGGAATVSAPTNGDIRRYGLSGVLTRGGDSYFQIGGVANTAGSYGAGGGGGTISVTTGAAGGSGMIRIWEYS